MTTASRFRFIQHIPNDFFTNARLKAEPNLTMCSLEFTKEFGGECINHIIESLSFTIPPHSLITARTAYLVPGTYSWMPGWHCDGHKLNDTISTDYPNEHTWVGHFGSAYAPTEVIDQDVATGGIQYNGSYLELNTFIKNQPQLHVKQAVPGNIMQLRSVDIHRCTPSRNT